MVRRGFDFYCLTPFLTRDRAVGAVHAVGALRRPPRPPPGSLVAPLGSVDSSKCEEQLLLSVQKMLRYLFPSFALQPARLCIGAMGHSHPENHGASLSDPSERLAPRSQGSVESG